MRAIVFTAILFTAAPALGSPRKRGSAAGDSRPTPAPPPVDPAVKSAAMAAKLTFISRVELCAPPQRCDRETLTVVEEAEKKFMLSCRACASDLKKCDEDRDAIRGGKGSRSYNPCE